MIKASTGLPRTERAFVAFRAEPLVAMITGAVEVELVIEELVAVVEFSVLLLTVAGAVAGIA
jgi:hypothetical protein